MVDAAYGEFAEEDLTSTALTLPNALVFRTFSKAYGLAGLRVDMWWDLLLDRYSQTSWRTVSRRDPIAAHGRGRTEAPRSA